MNHLQCFIFALSEQTGPQIFVGWLRRLCSAQRSQAEVSEVLYGYLQIHSKNAHLPSGLRIATLELTRVIHSSCTNGLGSHIICPSKNTLN